MTESTCDTMPSKLPILARCRNGAFYSIVGLGVGKALDSLSFSITQLNLVCELKTKRVTLRSSVA